MKLSARIVITFIVAGAFFVSGFLADSFAATSPDEDMEKADSMRTLILLRHAKSDKSNMNMPDIQRPLEASGRDEAKEMGEYLKQHNDHIDAIYSSPSVRTKQTLEIICPIIGYDYSKIIFDSTLYACSGRHLEEQIRHTDSKYRTVIYVGHNPSMTDVANSLQKDSVISEVKTCGVVKIDFTCKQWSGISGRCGVLSYYHKPN